MSIEIAHTNPCSVLATTNLIVAAAAYTTSKLKRMSLNSMLKLRHLVFSEPRF